MTQTATGTGTGTSTTRYPLTNDDRVREAFMAAQLPMSLYTTTVLTAVFGDGSCPTLWESDTETVIEGNCVDADGSEFSGYVIISTDGSTGRVTYADWGWTDGTDGFSANGAHALTMDGGVATADSDDAFDVTFVQGRTSLVASFDSFDQLAPMWSAEERTYDLQAAFTLDGQYGAGSLDVEGSATYTYACGALLGLDAAEPTEARYILNGSQQVVLEREACGADCMVWAGAVRGSGLLCEDASTGTDSGTSTGTDTGGGGGSGNNDTALGYLAIGADINLGSNGKPTGGVGYFMAFGGTADGAMPTGSPICDAHGNFNVHSDSWSASTDTSTSTATDTPTATLPTPACPDCDWAFVTTAVEAPAATGNCSGLLYEHPDGGLADFGFDALPGIFVYYALGFQPTLIMETGEVFSNVVWMAFPTFNSDGTSFAGHGEWTPWGYVYGNPSGGYSYGVSGNVTTSATQVSFRSATRLTLYYTP